MATALCLPLHADIHEFSVMFTKSVKKKAKDWHDGYLKWHTFNYRAILYDDHRKPVANEFFPNRTITSHSDLEFSNAIVQIGDQLETLQANLEHIYRNHGNPGFSDSTTTTTAAVNAQPRTPTIASHIQKRVYPPTSAPQSKLRSIVPQKRSSNGTLPTQETPIRLVPSRRVGIARPSDSPSSLKKVIYPGTDIQSLTNKRVPKITKPGWFACEDQDAETSAVVVSASVAPATKRVRKPAGSSGASKRKESLRHLQKAPAENERDDAIESEKTQQASHSTKSVQTAVVDEMTGQGVAREPSLICSDSSAWDSQEISHILSNLDPTRVQVKAKPRRLLAAARSSKKPLDLQHPEKASLRLSKGHGSESTAKLPRDGPYSLEADICEAILDVDSLRWISNDAPDTMGEITVDPQAKNNEESPHVVECSAPEPDVSEPEASTPSMSIPILDQYSQEVLIPSTPLLCAVWEDEALSQNLLAPIVSAVPSYGANSAALEEDEFGFVEAKSPKQKRKPSLTASFKIKPQSRHRRPRQALVEQLPEARSPTHNEESLQSFMDLPLPTLPSGSSLFLPDFPASPHSSSPGPLTQFACRAAKEIASHSALGRLGPGNRKKHTILPRLHKQVGTPAAESLSHNLVSGAILTKSSLRAVVPLEKAAVSREDFIVHKDMQTDLEVKSCLAKQVPQKSRPPEPADHQDEYYAATQMNTRAPDFMSAKSFQKGARLQVDKPIAAVGLSAREIAALDMSDTEFDEIQEPGTMHQEVID